MAEHWSSVEGFKKVYLQNPRIMDYGPKFKCERVEESLHHIVDLLNYIEILYKKKKMKGFVTNIFKNMNFTLMVIDKFVWFFFFFISLL